MPRTRVLVAEDSPTVRQALVDVLQGDPDIEVVGIATNGREAVELCARLRPDVITMDMVMPEVDGLMATEQIMGHMPTPILVVSASINRGELFKTYDALAAGAVDVLEKPTGREPEGEWERQFLAAVKLVARIRVITHLRARRPRDGMSVTGPGPAPLPPPETSLVAIGASTGGPGAIVEVLRALPVGLGVPVLLVLHINPQFSRAFAEWLGGQTPWPAQFATGRERLRDLAGKVLIAPAGQHMVVHGGRVYLDDGPERHSCKPSVDVLFDSLAAECGPTVAAALLTGMGRDGASGLLAIRRAGGWTVAQDEASSVVYGMPREAALLGAADRILPIGEIGAALAARVRAEGVTP